MFDLILSNHYPPGEMLTAYFPEFISVPHVSICEWMFKLSAEISESKQGEVLFITIHL